MIDKGKNLRSTRRKSMELSSNEDTLRALRITQAEIDALTAVGCGLYKRGSMAIIAAIRTKLEWTLAKPKQETELTGSVSLTVVSPLPGAPGSARQQAKALPVATGSEKALDSGQGPITANMSTSESVDMPTESEVAPVVVNAAPFDPMTAPTIHRDWSLVAGEPVPATAEERRAAERDAWMSDKAALKTADALTQQNRG